MCALPLFIRVVPGSKESHRVLLNFVGLLGINPAVGLLLQLFGGFEVYARFALSVFYGVGPSGQIHEDLELDVEFNQRRITYHSNPDAVCFSYLGLVVSVLVV